VEIGFGNRISITKEALLFTGYDSDPVALMKTVGAVAGVVCGLSLVMIVIGLVGKKV
jgi:uncharacterized protein involved in exopolysaccharide biosynthesis